MQQKDLHLTEYCATFSPNHPKRNCIAKMFENPMDKYFKFPFQKFKISHEKGAQNLEINVPLGRAELRMT